MAIGRASSSASVRSSAVFRNARLINVVCAVVVSAAACSNSPSSGDTTAADPDVATAGSTAQPPWPAPVEGVPALVAEAGLDLGPMGTAEHYHPHLRIVVDGKDVPVPPNIGVDVTTGAMSALHTHEGDGTLHIEADTKGQVFRLGQLFTQWGVSLGPDHVGGVRAESAVQVTVNGTPYGGDPTDLELKPEQQIVLNVP